MIRQISIIGLSASIMSGSALPASTAAALTTVRYEVGTDWALASFLTHDPNHPSYNPPSSSRLLFPDPEPNNPWLFLPRFDEAAFGTLTRAELDVFGQADYGYTWVPDVGTEDVVMFFKIATDIDRDIPETPSDPDGSFLAGPFSIPSGGIIVGGDDLSDTSSSVFSLNEDVPAGATALLIDYQFDTSDPSDLGSLIVTPSKSVHAFNLFSAIGLDKGALSLPATIGATNAGYATMAIEYTYDLAPGGSLPDFTVTATDAKFGLSDSDGEVLYTGTLTLDGGEACLPATDFSTYDPTRQNFLVLDDGGSVTLTTNGGSLATYGLVVGDTTTDSTYTQWAGTTYFMDRIILGREVGSRGVLTQEGGSVMTNATIARREIWVGYLGDGEYHMKGGTINQDPFISGTFHRPRISIGLLGDGTFTHSGGVVNAHTVRVGYHTGQGTYTMSGGTLNTTELSVSYAATSNPANDGNGRLDVTDAAADINLTGLLRFGGHSEYTAVAGTTITFSGAYDADIEIENPDANDLLGLNQTTLVFDDVIFTATLEAAGRDNYANLLDGFTGNFALDTLELTAEFAGGAEELDLVDNFDNQAGLADAVFITNLVLAAGTSINLNGIDLYYQTLTGGGSILTANGGVATQVVGGAPVPEPATTVFGLLALSGLRRQRRRPRKLKSGAHP